MVDSDTQKDQGGNPLGEGTIMGGHPEQPAWRRDNFMHGKVTDLPTLAALVESDLRLPDGTSIPESGSIPNHTCPSCRVPSSMNGYGECLNCGYTIPYDGGEWEDMPGADELLDPRHLEKGRGPWKNPSTLPALGPAHQGALAALVDPMLNLRCPNCGGEVMQDPDQGDIFCVHCDHSWPVRGEEDPAVMKGWQRVPHAMEHGFSPGLIETPGALGPVRQGSTHEAAQQAPCATCESDALVLSDGTMYCPQCKQATPPASRPEPTNVFQNQETWRTPPAFESPKEPGLLQRMFASEMDDIVGLTPESQPSTMQWEPGWQGRGLMIAGEPHTWKAYHPRDANVDPNESFNHGTSHSQYVESAGIPHHLVDWKSGVEIRPTGEVETVTGRDASPFIAADPRLKELEDKSFSFSKTMPKLERTNNMDPYLPWTHEADVDFDKGPDENVAPAHSLMVQPSDVGLHNAHGNHKGPLAFLDAHINGIPVRGNGSELIKRYGLRESPEFGKPVVVSVHDPSHLPAAAQVVQDPNARSPLMVELAQKIRNEEAPAPPGIRPLDIAPSQSEQDQSLRDRDQGYEEHAGGIKTAGPALLALPELAEGVGAAGAVGGEASAGGAASGLMGKALGPASNFMGGDLGRHMPGGGGEAPGQAGPDSTILNPLSSTDPLIALIAKGGEYETPTSNPDVGVKHDDPEDVDQKEFNDQDKSPENPLNPNLEDSGKSGEDPHKDKRDEESHGFSESSPAIERMKLLMPLIEHFYHSDESGANDPMLKGLHEMLEAENPGYLGKGDPTVAEIFIQQKKKPEHVHAGLYADGDAVRSPDERRRYDQGLDEWGAKQYGERRIGPDRRQEPEPVMCPACKSGQIIGPACNQCGTTVEDILSAPTSREGQTKESIVPPLQMGGLQQQQQMLDPTALNPSLQPTPQAPPGGGAQQGHCKNCGGVTTADGTCPQCGAKENAMGGATPQGQQIGGPSMPAPMQSFTHLDLIASLVDSANHQGPVTPEQIAAVQQWLIENGRVNEVPNVPLDPGNPEYAKILAEIQQNPTVPPTVTPEEQTQPPAPQQPAPGGMPVPGMGGEPGGQPMQPMSSFLPDFTAADDLETQHQKGQHVHGLHPDCPICAQKEKAEPYREFEEEMGSKLMPGHTAADNIAPRCPVCNSATTGMVGDPDNHSRCHACGNVWKGPSILDDTSAAGNSAIARVAGPGPEQDAQPVNVPAAEQDAALNQGGDEDSSLTWKDTEGNPIQAKQEYTMKNPSFSVPDVIRVERVKPDGLDVTLLGMYGNDSNTLKSSVPISKEDMEMQELTFEPLAQNADDRNNEPPPGSQTPGEEQVPPSGQTTDERANSELQPSQASVDDDSCPRCGHNEHTSSMINPDATEHDCFRCGHNWVTEEKGGRAEAGVDIGWVMEDDDAEDFLGARRQSMAAAQSRDIGSIQDSRREEIRARLAHNKQERMQREGGKHFTPREQRELIDEDGMARNSDMLDLEGTHYKTRDSYDSKTDPERVRDADLFLGV